MFARLRSNVLHEDLVHSNRSCHRGLQKSVRCKLDAMDKEFMICKVLRAASQKGIECPQSFKQSLSRAGKRAVDPRRCGPHTGTAYVGAAEGIIEIAVLGIAPTLCARLSSKDAAGEVFISEDSVKSGNLDVSGLESRSPELNSVSQSVSVRVMRV